jgi:hypothetical protein
LPPWLPRPRGPSRAMTRMTRGPKGVRAGNTAIWFMNSVLIGSTAGLDCAGRERRLIRQRIRHSQRDRTGWARRNHPPLMEVSEGGGSPPRRDPNPALSGSREKSQVRKCSGKPMGSADIHLNRHLRVRVLSAQPRSQGLREQKWTLHSLTSAHIHTAVSNVSRQSNRPLVCYPGMKELLRQVLETAPRSDRQIMGRGAAMRGPATRSKCVTRRDRRLLFLVEPRAARLELPVRLL